MSELEESYFDRKFKELELSNARLIGDLEGKVDGFLASVQNLERKQSTLEEENLNLKYEIQRLRKDVSFLMNKESACNLIIENCTIKEGEDSESKIRDRLLKLFKQVNVQIEPENIISAKRLGKPTPGKIQLIKVKLSDPGLKKLIFPAAKDFRKRYNIYIKNDYSPPQREELYNIRVTRRLLIEHGINCYVRGFNIVVTDAPLNWQAAKRLLDKELALRSGTEKEAMEEDFSGYSDSSVNSCNAKRKHISPIGNNKKKIPKPRRTLNSKLLRPSTLSQTSLIGLNQGSRFQLQEPERSETTQDSIAGQASGPNPYAELLDRV